MEKKNLPKPTGEYAVGTFTYTVKDHRKDVLRDTFKNDRKGVSGIPEMRSVACRVYYPTLKSSVEGLEKKTALSKNMVEGLKRCFHVPTNYEKETAAGNNVSECYPDAPPIEGEKFPLILFNHGYQSYREGNSFLLIELASHGYVVISVAHSLEGLCTEFDDGSYLFYDKRLTKKMYEPFWRGFIEGSKLIKAKGTLEELAELFDDSQKKYCRFIMGRTGEWVKDNEAALDYAKENLSDLIDFSNGIGASGHSMGGNTAYRLCVDKDEVVCGINIDGGLFGDYNDAVLNKPFLQVSCEVNENVVARVYLKHTEPVYKAVFRDMKHVGFSDMKHQMNIGSMVGKLDADAMHENLCRCHLEMFDTYLKKTKSEPVLRSNDIITVSKYDPDMV